MQSPRAIPASKNEGQGLSARITRNSSGFLASLSDGRKIEAGAIRDLAYAMHKAGVHVDDAHCADWREGEASLSAGTAIAFKVEMRKLGEML